MRRSSPAVLVLMAVLSSVLPLHAQRRGDEPPADLPALAERIGTLVQWHADDPVVIEEGRNRQEVGRSAKEHAGFDRVAAFDAALEKARAEQRLVFWYAPRITAGSGGRQMYRPGVLDVYMKAVFFTDPEVADLLNRRFVPVRLIADGSLGQRVGISAPDVVEPAIFLIDPEGNVLERVDRIRSFNVAWLLGLLQDVLDARPAAASPAAPAPNDGDETQDRLAPALACLQGGYLAQAADQLARLAEELEGPERVRSLVLLARTHRRLRKPDQALEALEEADKAAMAVKAANEGDRPRGRRGGPDLAGMIACERGRILLLQGKLDEAAVQLMSVGRGPSQPEALYYLGLCDWFDHNDQFAIRRWKDVIAADRESPYAWKAAANLVDGRDRTPLGPGLHGFEDPTAPLVRFVHATDTAVPRPKGELRDLARDAVQFLLRMQRENGGWTDSRYAYWGGPEITPNVWVAVTALACTALQEWRDLAPEEVAAAVERGERFIFEERHMARGVNEEIYADGYKLLYLARKHDLVSDPEERHAIVARMNEVVRRLSDTQHRESGRSEGFWAHEYPNPFCTAAVMNSLHLAKERGAAVPDAMMELGAKALLSVRDEHGAFAYSAGRKPGGEVDRRLKDSMGRSPICEAAILWAGDSEGSVEKVAAASENFWRFYPRLEKIRKCDFHTDGELGGFFFWHSLFHTSEAFKALPEDAQAEHRARLSDVILKIAELDGSFIDSHEMGKSYGTAMGLITLKNTLEDRKP